MGSEAGRGQDLDDKSSLYAMFESLQGKGGPKSSVYFGKNINSGIYDRLG